MEKYKFEHNTAMKKYIATIEGIEIFIDEDDYNENNIERSIAIAKIYPTKLEEIARFCVESETFKLSYPEFNAFEVMDKLLLPRLYLDNLGGIFSYCNNKLDNDHIIDIEFTGNIEKIDSVNIDG